MLNLSLSEKEIKIILNQNNWEVIHQHNKAYYLYLSICNSKSMYLLLNGKFVLNCEGKNFKNIDLGFDFASYDELNNSSFYYHKSREEALENLSKFLKCKGIFQKEDLNLLGDLNV